MRTETGDYRRDHLSALAQRIEVDTKEVRIVGATSMLLCTLVAARGAKSAGFGVPSFVSKWRANQNKKQTLIPLKLFVIFLASMVRRPSAPTSAVVGYFSAPLTTACAFCSGIVV
jgi:hypothetical protein